ncbi:MAG: GTPase HflX [Myxococcota bacterium]|nr:GTPase HflX [Myxococcota bacterium]MDW8361653.1 GTPase HflX [Myxococcales bacterium]
MTEGEVPTAVLVGVQLPDVSDDAFERSLVELERLADTLGLRVVGRVVQRLAHLERAAVLGSGKLRELARWTGGPGVVPSAVPAHRRRKAGRRLADASDQPEPDAPLEAADGDDKSPATAEGERAARARVVLVDHEITPSQLRNLERATGAEVLDRTGVILAIFHRHARSREARLQVELARLRHEAPRLREAGAGADRVRGGIGGKGAGESALELDRRRIRDRIAELRRELDAIERSARVRRAHRGEACTVALVGYTNAGKSSLMRALTGSDVLVADALFATLDTTVRVLRPETVPRILVTDTVGFIDRLPHALVASFRSTLAEAREADLLVHVVDAADPAHERQMQVTVEVLAELEAAHLPRLLAFNKADRLDEATRGALAERWPDAWIGSALDPDDVGRLRDRITAHFERDLVEHTLELSFAQLSRLGALRRACRVLDERWTEAGVRLRLRGPHALIEALRSGGAWPADDPAGPP